LHVKEKSFSVFFEIEIYNKNKQDTEIYLSQNFFHVYMILYNQTDTDYKYYNYKKQITR